MSISLFLSRKSRHDDRFLGLSEVRQLCMEIQRKLAQENAVLVKNLRLRDKNLSKLQRNCDIITAILQAASLKRRESTFSSLINERKYIVCVSRE